jgi:hypothetical protein
MFYRGRRSGRGIKLWLDILCRLLFGFRRREKTIEYRILLYSEQNHLPND